MSNLRRHYQKGHSYFVTCVTIDRKPLLSHHEKELREAISFVHGLYRFNLAAWVILPDHFHAIMTPTDNDLSKIVSRTKLKFSGSYRSRHSLVRGRIWQHRFWDHRIRDQEDMNRHIDYIHYNPVKHGLGSSPFEWEHSSIHTSGVDYAPDWGATEPKWSDRDFGE